MNIAQAWCLTCPPAHATSLRAEGDISGCDDSGAVARALLSTILVRPEARAQPRHVRQRWPAASRTRCRSHANSSGNASFLAGPPTPTGSRSDRRYWPSVGRHVGALLLRTDRATPRHQRCQPEHLENRSHNQGEVNTNRILVANRGRSPCASAAPPPTWVQLHHRRLRRSGHGGAPHPRSGRGSALGGDDAGSTYSNGEKIPRHRD